MKHKFLIVGGGTAGWMTATLFQRAFPEASISLVESDTVATIGVGEGSTPALKSFMDAIGAAEHEWMPRCQATYKSGISFQNWSITPGYTEYFHPFFSHFDRDHIKALEFNSTLKRNGKDVHSHPNAFCYSHYLANKKLCPIPPYSFPFEVQYGYHFDAGLLGQYLKELAISRGVEWQNAHIKDVVLNENGEVSHLKSDDGAELRADFFIDCSGFASIITKQALKTPSISYADALFNDAAVTILTDQEEEVSTQTVSSALPNGWAWRIPLKNRVGNGYVYSSKYSSAENAEKELRTHLGKISEGKEARHLKMQVGRSKTMWNKNCLAVGLSQGFLEPLEATALALVQMTLTRFVKYYTAGSYTNQYADQLNHDIASAFDGVKDYIHTHFLTSNRIDTPYWQDCRQNSQAMSDRLKQVIQVWFQNGNLAEVLHKTGLDQHYKINSWIYILSGMGIFPPADKLSPPSQDELAKVPIASIEDFFKRCTLNHKTQEEAFSLHLKGQPVEAACSETKNALEQLIGLGFATSS